MPQIFAPSLYDFPPRREPHLQLSRPITTNFCFLAMPGGASSSQGACKLFDLERNMFLRICHASLALIFFLAFNSASTVCPYCGADFQTPEALHTHVVNDLHETNYGRTPQSSEMARQVPATSSTRVVGGVTMYMPDLAAQRQAIQNYAQMGTSNQGNGQGGQGQQARQIWPSTSSVGSEALAQYSAQQQRGRGQGQGSNNGGR
ncbi:hypothetical protein DL93DRAFT_2094358 [Clavulina sp. PMI_390]|nr:hypothetical protein DL93DRAFT_2094358 [Clavulina sp. PMI_390]